MFKEPITRHSYQFPNLSSHEWLSWKVDDDGSSILSGLVVKTQLELIEILCDDSTSCKEADDNNDFNRRRQRRTFNMSVTWMRISFEYLQYLIELSCLNVKLSFLFAALYLALYAQY